VYLASPRVLAPILIVPVAPEVIFSKPVDSAFGVGA
jgi:hypothetical protein